MWFRIIYCIYFIVCLFYSPIMVFGPVSVRHLFTVLMLALCIREGGLKYDRFLKWYVVFLFFCFLSALLSGFVEVFVTKFLGTYLSALVLYLSTKTMVSKYNAQNWVLYLVLGAACLNSIVAIGQFFKMPIAVVIPDVLGIRLESDMVELYERIDDFRGRYVGGLLGVVYSGYFLSAACVLSLCVNQKSRMINWILFAVNFYALFLVQQRGGFFIGMFCVILYLVVAMARRRRFVVFYYILFVVAATLIWYYGTQLSSYSEMRYSTYGFTDEHRGSLAANGWNYFLNHPFGGIYAFRAAGNVDPHNLFLNAFLYGGIIGGSIIILYIFYQLFFVGKVMYQTFLHGKYSSIILGFGLAYVDYTLNSMLHNLSLVYGDIMFFLLWGMVMALCEKESNVLDYSKKTI